MINILAIIAAKYLFLLSVVIAGVYFFFLPREKQKDLLVLSLVALPLIGLTAFIAGHLYTNPRPFVVEHFVPLIPHDENNGFPSDHALLVSAIAALLYFSNRRVSAILWLVAIVVSFGRVYVGVHHTVDVLASMLIAWCGTQLAYLLIKRVKK